MINIDKHVRPIKKTTYKTYDKQALDDLIRQTAVFDHAPGLRRGSQGAKVGFFLMSVVFSQQFDPKKMMVKHLRPNTKSHLSSFILWQLHLLQTAKRPTYRTYFVLGVWSSNRSGFWGYCLSGISWLRRLLATCASADVADGISDGETLKVPYFQGIGVCLTSTTEAGLPNLLSIYCKRLCFVKGKIGYVTIAEGRRIISCVVSYLCSKRGIGSRICQHLPWQEGANLAYASCNSDWTTLLVVVSRHATMASENVWSTELDSIATCPLSGRWTTSDCVPCLLGIKELQSSVLRVPLAAHFFSHGAWS